MILRIDHLVLTVHSIEETCAFYERALGFERVDASGRTSLHFGVCKLNLHQVDHTFEPKADVPTPGSADFCVITEQAIEAIMDHLRDVGIDIELGPVARNGAVGAITSVYLRDPDRNLVEISCYSA